MTVRRLSLPAVALLALALPNAAPAAGTVSIAIQPQFEGAGLFHEGVAPARQDGLWGLIDRSGAWVVKPAYEVIGIGSDGRFPFRQDGLWGYLDTLGEVVIPAQYEDAWPMSEGVAAVRQGGLWGFITQQGVVETTFRYEEIGGREGSYISARDGEGWAIFDPRIVEGYRMRRPVARWEDGESVEAAPLYSISEGAVVAKFDDGECLAALAELGDDLMPQQPCEPRFASVRRRSEGLAAVSEAAGHWGYMDRQGRVHWRGRFEDALTFTMGLAPVKSGGKWGLIDTSGRFALKPTYDAIYPFQEGHAVMRQGKLRGFLDRQPRGRIAVLAEPQFEDVFRFSEGLAPVKLKGVWGYLSDGSEPEAVRGVVDIQPQGEIVDVVPE